MRSQKKTKLTKITNITLDNNQTGIVQDDENIFELLGTYKSKKRALEVLDEIQEVLCPKVLIMKPKSQITISDNVNLVLPDNCSYERIGDTYVYEMPEE